MYIMRKTLKKLVFLIIVICIGNYCFAQNENANPKTHFISKDEAKKMIAVYKEHQNRNINIKNREIFALTESFDAEAFRILLAKPGCKRVRIYYGMSDDLRLHAIIVGVDANNVDILDGVASIMERGVVCPPICPTPEESELEQN